MSVLPTFGSAAAAAEEDGPTGKGGNGPLGRIFFHANLRTKATRAGKTRDIRGDVRGVIAVDPTTGRWEKIVDEAVAVRVFAVAVSASNRSMRVPSTQPAIRAS
jgi:hypothetical protein